MSKAQMALEYIVKLMILLVVITVIITIIIKFKDDIKTFINEFFGKNVNILDFPKIIDKNTFNPGEVSTYIEDCYYTMVSLPENEQKDIVCYVLISETSFSPGFQTNLRDALSDDIEGIVDIQTVFDRDVVKIQYVDVGNRILVLD